MNTSAEYVISNRRIERDLVAPLAEVLRSKELSIEVTYGTLSGNSAARLDVDGKHAIGRLTWWSQGTHYSEVLRTSDSVTVFDLHGSASCVSQALAALHLVCEKVATEPASIP
jgi:hypothetical protein